MPDQKITQLIENTSPVAADLAVMVDDPAGVPATEKVTLANLIGQPAVTVTGLRTFQNNTDAASVQAAIFEGDRATPAAGDEAYISLRLSDSAGNQDEFGRIAWVAVDETSTTEDGRIDFYNIVGGSLQSTPIMSLDGSDVFINETANANQTVGLTINQGTNDDEILTLKSSDVAQPFTGDTESDTYGFLSKIDAATGGLLVEGLNESWTTWGLALRGSIGSTSAQSTKTATSRGVVNIQTYKSDGTGPPPSRTALTGTENAVALINSSTTMAIFGADGDLYLDTALNTTAWDDHDDLALLHGLRASLVDPEHELRRRFGHFIKEARPTLESTGVVTYNDDGHHFVAMKKWCALLTDTIRQEGGLWRQAFLELKDRLEIYEAALAELGIDPRWLETEYPLQGR